MCVSAGLADDIDSYNSVLYAHNPNRFCLFRGPLFCFLLCFLLLSFVRTTSALPDLEYQYTGRWNTFLAQTNVLECVNTAYIALTFSVAFRNQDGAELARVEKQIAAQASMHLLINPFVTENSLGSLSLALPEDLTGFKHLLRCAVAVYRFRTKDNEKPLDFAYYLPLGDFQTGTSLVQFSTENPEAALLPSFSWLSLINLEQTSLSGTASVYDQQGLLLDTINVSQVPPGGRRDFAVLPSFLTQARGTVIFTPAEANQHYHLNLTRFGLRADEFTFALTQDGIVQGNLGCPATALSSPPLRLSTFGPAQSFITISNPDSLPQQGSVQIYTQANELLSNIPLSLPAHGQQQIAAHEILGLNRLGYAKLSCPAESSRLHMAAHSFGYLNNLLTWGNTSSHLPRVSQQGERLVFGLNTFLGAYNWLKISTPGETPQLFASNYLAENARVLGTYLEQYPSNTNVDNAAHILLPANSIGSVSQTPLMNSTRLISESIRVYPTRGGEIGGILSVPPHIVPSGNPQVVLERVAENLVSPVLLTHAGDGTGRKFIIERIGRIRIIQGNDLLQTPYLDISSKTSIDGERGLLSLAFPKDFSNSGRFYALYTALDGAVTLSRFSQSQADSNQADANSEEVLLSIAHGEEYHYGGQIAFGTDGLLYISVGDGGPQGDPSGNAQNLGVLLGKILRLDVSQNGAYQIPADNPFVGQNGVREEVYAYGFRNPWRFSVDRGTGRIFVADVGQNAREEINLLSRAGNFGWNIVEGTRCHQPEIDCDFSEKIPPIAEYDHSEGIAVIGGYVYRGKKLPGLSGRYFFTDFLTGRLWMLEETAPASWQRTEIAQYTNEFFTSFGEDEDGELYLLNLSGEVFRLDSPS